MSEQSLRALLGCTLTTLLGVLLYSAEWEFAGSILVFFSVLKIWDVLL